MSSRKRKNSDANIVSHNSFPSKNINNVEDDNITSLPKASKILDKVTQTLLCPITHELMVDPVLAEDGHTYERSSIEEWLSKNHTSPLIPNKRLKVSNLFTDRTVQETTEALVETGAVEKKLTVCWKEKKKDFNLKKAKKMFDEGCILDAAKLGLPKAQGEVSNRYFHGTNGVEKDLKQSLEWAKKAAEGGDYKGQFRMGYFNHMGIQGIMSKNIPEAISWYEKAANQGSLASKKNLGVIYENGGYELGLNYCKKAAFWFEKGAEENEPECLIKIGELYYKGAGVTKSYDNARQWFEKAVDKIDRRKIEWSEANFWLGKMMVRGEGGSKDFIGGITLIEKAASKGFSTAKKCLESIAEVLG